MEDDAVVALAKKVHEDMEEAMIDILMEVNFALGHRSNPPSEEDIQSFRALKEDLIKKILTELYSHLSPPAKNEYKLRQDEGITLDKAYGFFKKRNSLFDHYVALTMLRFRTEEIPPRRPKYNIPKIYGKEWVEQKPEVVEQDTEVEEVAVVATSIDNLPAFLIQRLQERSTHVFPVKAVVQDFVDKLWQTMQDRGITYHSQGSRKEIEKKIYLTAISELYDYMDLETIKGFSRTIMNQQYGFNDELFIAAYQLIEVPPNVDKAEFCLHHLTPTLEKLRDKYLS